MCRGVTFSAGEEIMALTETRPAASRLRASRRVSPARAITLRWRSPDVSEWLLSECLGRNRSGLIAETRRETSGVIYAVALKACAAEGAARCRLAAPSSARRSRRAAGTGRWLTAIRQRMPSPSHGRRQPLGSERLTDCDPMTPRAMRRVRGGDLVRAHPPALFRCSDPAGGG